MFSDRSYFFDSKPPSRAEKSDSVGFSFGMAASPNNERYALSGSLFGVGGSRSPAKCLNPPNPISLAGDGDDNALSGTVRVAKGGGVSTACRRIADMIEALFHPTISTAARCTASGSRSCPHGFTPTIGFL